MALIGTGLTAVDAVLTLRRLGYAGQIVAISRTGLLPRTHLRDAAPMTLAADAAAELTSVSAIVRFIRDRRHGDWRGPVDALRPHTNVIWQRLDPKQQLSVTRRWGTYWGVHRHRMAPENGAIIDGELRSGMLRIVAGSSIQPRVGADGGLELELRRRGGAAERLRTSAVIDCTGPVLDVSASGQPLLRGLVEDSIAAAHHTGRGLVADDEHRVAEDLYAIGSLLSGQLWESVAVPELRGQAAVIASAIATRTQAGSVRQGADGERAAGVR